MNTTYRSDAYHQVHSLLKDAQEGRGRYVKTWPALYPLCRIDHIFVSKRVSVERVEAPRTRLTRVASDHLPLIADLSIEDLSIGLSLDTRNIYNPAP